MRYAPKFLGQWERIDRMIEDRAAEAHAEIRCMAAAAISKIPALPSKTVFYNHDVWMLGNAGMFSLASLQGGMRALTPFETQEMVRQQMSGMANSANPYAMGFGSGLCGLGTIGASIFWQ